MNVIGSKYEDRSTRQEARRRDMAACMVTHGRGLDDFVWQEILEEIPAARNLRHLGEGKIAFQIHQEASVASTGAQQRRGDVREEKGAARGTSRQQKDFRADTVQKEDTDDAFSELHTKGNQREQNTALKEINAALATNLEENKWISALSNIFKLKLVERVFLLLHCEDIDGKATHEGIDRKSNEEDILKDYENKLASVAVSNYWDILAVRVRRLRQHQDGERRVWCQDPDSCPGALRKRQERKELREKRVASAASREVVGSFSKHQEADSINREPFQGRETTGQGNKKRKLTDDCRKKTFVESYDVFKQENIKMKDIPDSNIEETSHRSVRKECEFQNVFRNERQKLQSICIPEVTTTDDLVTGGAKDSPGAVISHECASSQLDKECKDEVVVTVSKTTSATNKVNMISENNKSLENSQLMSSACPPSTPESSSEKLKRESQDCETKSKEHVSTFRVSSRVSGPHKHFLPVKWINRTLTQQLNSVMTSWLPDWRLPLVDLYVNITVSHFVVGAALSPRPLSLRPYIPHPTLRSTISHLMATLSQLPPKATVLDPMCGGGSILLEAAMSFDVCQSCDSK